jgi:20S proteasome subunit alpha 6
MRQKAMQSRMLYARPIPVGRIVQSIADRAQTNTQYYGKRPYGVGFLVVGEDVSDCSLAGSAYILG